MTSGSNLTTAAADRREENRVERPASRIKRRESVISGMALAALVVLLSTVAAGGWWSARTQREAADNTRYEQLLVLADMLAANSERLLGAGELTALRRMLSEAAAQNHLEDCRILLPDGRIIADSEPGKITLAALPAHWPSGPLDGRSSGRTETGRVALVRSLLIPNRGAATLEMSASLRAVSSGVSELALGLGVLTITALGALWLIYRHIRRRVRGVGLIQEALAAVAAGERSAEVLALSPELGAEAVAWNELLRERGDAQRASLAGELGDRLNRRREPRGELELACDLLSVGLAVIDEKGCVRQANGAAASLLRVRRNELAGKPLVELLPDESAKIAIGSLTAGKSSQRRTWEVSLDSAEVEGAERRKGEEEHKSVLRVTLRPLRKEDSCAALLTLEDVTQQRVAEASRSAFVAQATHELRTPLTNMRLCIETALEEPEQDAAAVGQCMNLLNSEVRRLERMVSEMLSVAEIEAGSLKVHADDVRLDAMFESLRAEVAPLAAEKSIELKFDLPPKFPVIYADGDKLVLALHNLIGNAIKYTPAGGKVTVVVRPDGKQLSVDVTDTGIGIRPEEQEQIFERFYRAQDPRVAKISGTGLGLALSREVARIHGGDVSVQSEIDKGSTFSFTVPFGKAA